jgi:hypothetical protein
MTGGAFGPEASIFAVVVDTIAVLMLWRWKGIAHSRAPLPVVEAA